MTKKKRRAPKGGVSKYSNRMRMHDESLMPFGKWKGKRLIDVPDYYWRWFVQQDWVDKFPDLLAYAELAVADAEDTENNK